MMGFHSYVVIINIKETHVVFKYILVSYFIFYQLEIYIDNKGNIKYCIQYTFQCKFPLLL